MSNAQMANALLTMCFFFYYISLAENDTGKQAVQGKFVGFSTSDSSSSANENDERAKKLQGVPGFGAPTSGHPRKYIQPDGSIMTIRYRGDRVINWIESAEGFAIIKNSQGFYEYAITNSADSCIPSGIRVSPDSAKQSTAELNFIAKGKKGHPYRDSTIRAKQDNYVKRYYDGQ